MFKKFIEKIKAKFFNKKEISKIERVFYNACYVYYPDSCIIGKLIDMYSDEVLDMMVGMDKDCEFEVPNYGVLIEHIYDEGHYLQSFIYLRGETDNVTTRC